MFKYFPVCPVDTCVIVTVPGDTYNAKTYINRLLYDENRNYGVFLKCSTLTVFNNQHVLKFQQNIKAWNVQINTVCI